MSSSIHLYDPIQRILEKYCLGFSRNLRLEKQDQKLAKISLRVNQNLGSIYLIPQRRLPGLRHDIGTLSKASGIPIEVVRRTFSLLARRAPL